MFVCFNWAILLVSWDHLYAMGESDYSEKKLRVLIQRSYQLVFGDLLRNAKWIK